MSRGVLRHQPWSAGGCSCDHIDPSLRVDQEMQTGCQPWEAGEGQEEQLMPHSRMSVQGKSPYMTQVQDSGQDLPAHSLVWSEEHHISPGLDFGKGRAWSHEGNRLLKESQPAVRVTLHPLSTGVLGGSLRTMPPETPYFFYCVSS